jgi:SEFIR domain
LFLVTCSAVRPISPSCRAPPGPAVAWLGRGFRAAAADGSLLKIFILDEGVYEQLAAQDHQASAGTAAGPGAPRGQRNLTSGSVPPRVLISYTANSPAHQQWVDDLFRFLRAHGVNARLDTYFLRPGMDLVQWMCNELDLANRVILICDERYADRADRHHGGVGWETMIIQGDLYADMYRDRPEDVPAKYIPVARSADPCAGLPAYLKTLAVLHCPPGRPEGEFRSRLLDEILQRRPPIPPVVTRDHSHDTLKGIERP